MMDELDEENKAAMMEAERRRKELELRKEEEARAAREREEEEREQNKLLAEQFEENREYFEVRSVCLKRDTCIHECSIF